MRIEFMRVEFLGTGGYHPNDRRHTACIMLPEIGLILDAGTSMFRVPRYLRTEELTICLTHAHLDHIAGLSFLLPQLLDGRIKRARVFGSAGTLKAVREHLFSDALFPADPGLQYHELPPRLDVGEGGVLTHFPLTHPGGSLGFRIDWPGRSLAYITDTITDGRYLDFINGVDLLIHECYFPDEREEWARTTGHSCTSAVAHAARAAGVGRLVLVHVDPQQDTDDPINVPVARRIFPATELATDLLSLEI